MHISKSIFAHKLIGNVYSGSRVSNEETTLSARLHLSETQRLIHGVIRKMPDRIDLQYNRHGQVIVLLSSITFKQIESTVTYFHFRDYKKNVL